MPSRSITVTVAPSCAATSADSYPAGPPPMISTVGALRTRPLSPVNPRHAPGTLGTLPAMASSGGLYAAYGTNMDPEQMLERCPHSPAAGTGWLNGWRLTFGGEELGWDGALAMVVPDADSQTFVAIYDVSPHDLAVLDYWEGADTGLYNKIKLRVSTLDGDVLAWVYLLDGYEGGLPSARYLGLIAEAAQAAGAPDEYVAELRARSCRSLGE